MKTNYLILLIYVVVIFPSLNADGKTTRKIALPDVKLTEAYLGTDGFVFPKAKTINGIGSISLNAIVANYIINELNYSIRKDKTGNRFLQHVFGVASSDESDPPGQNSLTRLSAQLADANSKNPYLRLDSFIAREEKHSQENYTITFKVKNSRYKKGVLFFSLIDPRLNKDGYFETELAVSGIFLSY